MKQTTFIENKLDDKANSKMVSSYGAQKTDRYSYK